jgi:ABC-type sugar transport system substrate-binding protein
VRVFASLAIALLLGCAKDDLPDPVYALLMPQSDAWWAREIEAGFSAAAEQFFMKTRVIKFSNEDPEHIVEKLGDLDGGPVVVVTLSSDDAERLAASLAARNLRHVLIGPDEHAGSRAAHVVPSAANLAYHWKIRWNQMEPKPRSVLILFGDVPLARNDVVSAFYRRSNDWAEYQLRVRDVYDVQDKDIEWADLIVAIGEDAFDKSVINQDKEVVPVDGSDAALRALESGRVQRVFVPNYFQCSYRAARLARDAFLDVLNAPVSLQIPFEEVDAEYLPMFLKKRHSIPSIGSVGTE